MSGTFAQGRRVDVSRVETGEAEPAHAAGTKGSPHSTPLTTGGTLSTMGRRRSNGLRSQAWRISILTDEDQLLIFEVLGDEDEIEGLSQDIAWTYWQTSASAVHVPTVAEFRDAHPDLFERAERASRRVRGRRWTPELGRGHPRR